MTPRPAPMIRPAPALLLALMFLMLSALAAPPASAGVAYTQLDHPLAGSGGTTAYAIEAGRIVGGYLDAANVAHGFLYQGGTWTTLDHPEAAGGTTAFGVSATRISGSYVTASGETLGFLYDGVTWTTLARPPAGGVGGPADTFARGVSDATVVGYSIEAGVGRGFVYRDGTFTDVAPTGALNTFPKDVDGARIVGNYDDPVGTHGFILDGLNLRTLDHPLGGLLGTFVNGVDGDNVVGNYLEFPTGMSRGFLYDGAGFLPVDFPGATDTDVNGVDGAQVVGSFVDAAGRRHGFVATVPEPGAAAALLCLAAAACGRRSRHGRPAPSR